MKFITTSAFAILLLTVMSSLGQEVFINPASVTLTQQGSVTIIVTDTAASGTADTVTVGTIQASNSMGSWTSNQGSNIAVSSGAANGTLDAGTYEVIVNGNPQQVTVILWNEPANGGISISQVGLVTTSATTADQISFQALIASQAQQQIAVLQIQIASLQQSDPPPMAEIAPMQQQLLNVQSAYDQLTNSLTVTAVLTATNGQNGANGTNGSNGRDADSTLTYAGMGLGAAAFVGTIVNFFTQDEGKIEQSSSNPETSGSK